MLHQQQRDGIEVVGLSQVPIVGRTNANLGSARESLENFYTGSLATELNRSYSGTRGLSTHAVSNSLSMRQESMRLEKTLKLRQKTKELEEKIKIAVLHNQGLKQQNEELQYGCNLRQDKLEDMDEEIRSRDRTIQALKEQIAYERDQIERRMNEKVEMSEKAAEDLRLQNHNLGALNEDMRNENDALTVSKNTLEQRIFELE